MARAKMREREDPGAAARQSAMAGADFSSTKMLLTEILSGPKSRNESPFVTFWIEFFAIRTLHEAALRHKRKRASPKFVQPYPVLNRVVHSARFDIASGLVVLANGVTIGLQTSLENPGSGYEIVEYVFTTLFVLEILLRMTVDGWSWIWSWGNFADVFLVVVTGVIPILILNPMGINSNDGLIRIFAIVRVLRLVRLLRMVRMYSAFRIFWSLIAGVLDCFRTLVYSYLIITTVLYVFAIFAVYLIADDPSFQDDRLAQLYFGDVPKSMFTLFQIITLDSWFEVARPLMSKSPVVAPFVILVIAVVTLVLLNLVVAAIVDNSMQRANSDEEALAVQKREELAKDLRELAYLFDDMDSDGSGMLSKDEYEAALEENEEVTAKFEVLEIPPSEYQSVWDLVDDGSGEVSVRAFCDLIRSIRGDAKAKDTFSIIRGVDRWNRRAAVLSERLVQHRRHAAELRAEAAQARQQLGSLQHEMCDFLKLMGVCIPSPPAEVKVRDIERFSGSLHAEVEPLLPKLMS